MTLSEEDEVPFLGELNKPKSHQKYSWAKRFDFFSASFGILISILTSFCWVTILLHVRTSSNPMSKCDSHILPAPISASGSGTRFHTDAAYISCGKSIAESKKLGCRYDILSNHWVPAECMDEDSVKMYQKDGTWFGYMDENRTKRIESIEAMGSVDVYYTSMRDHIVHCAALWKKQFNAFFEDRIYMDSLILDSMHTHHCADFLVDMTDKGDVDFRDIPIKVEVGHAGCWVFKKGSHHHTEGCLN